MYLLSILSFTLIVLENLFLFVYGTYFIYYCFLLLISLIKWVRLILLALYDNGYLEHKGLSCDLYCSWSS